MYYSFLLFSLVCFSASKDFKINNIDADFLNFIFEPKEEIETKYDNLYVYKSPDGEVIQKLYVKYDLENYVKYKLVLVKTDCKLELVGEAEANQELDGEIDEDADGNAYMAIEFRHITEQFYFSIRIAEDKEKVKISYAPTLDGKEKCPLLTDLLMYSE